MRSPIHALIARATWGHLAYTSVFERVVEVPADTTAIYGALMAVSGAGGTVIVHTPNLVTPAVQAKMCFDFGVVNVDGAHTVTISCPDGKTINGGSVTLPASKGAFAWCFYDLTIGEWVAILNAAGDAFIPPPTYTVKGPNAQYDITTTPTAIPNVSITTAAFTAQQKAIITYSAVVRTDAGQQDDNTFRIFDGVVGSTIDAFIETCGNTSVDVNPAWNTVSWTLEVPGNGSARTFGLGVSGTNAGAICHLLAGTVRGVVQIVDG